nr:HAUS augmin-like complex subunit 3 isoform X1 [Cherax quadricarinatus]XP_053637535.1 HAUS augmin-like complex subunit 3 isoform X1 [Cherax quadricarinatus]
MNGERLVSHLQLLDVPGTDHLKGENYDWLFLENPSSPLPAFLEWFTENISANDVLTDEDLNEYEELMSKGEVLTGYHLEKMEACLSGLPVAFSTSEEDSQKDVLTLEECKRLKDQLKVLVMRRNQLSAHKMELREEVYQSSERLKEEEVYFKNHHKAILNTSIHLSKSQEEISKSLDAVTKVFLEFDKMPTEEAKFFSQLNLEEWYQEEDKFTDTLETYIRRQFREGVRDVAGAGDTSEYCLLDVSNLDLQLVRGAGNAEYAQNVDELKRLNNLLRQTEEWRLKGLLLQHQKRAEIEEANRQFAAIHRSQLPSNLALLEQQAREASESRKAVEWEKQQQQQVMQSLITEVAQLESTKTISGNYQLKRQRQEYFLDKQKLVMDELVSQVARYNWINIALDIERGKIADILNVLQSISSIITQKDVSYNKRMQYLQAFTKKHEEQKAAGQLPLPLVTLSRLLPVAAKQQSQEEHTAETVTGEYLHKQVAMLQKGLDVAREQVVTARNPQFSCLSRMTMNCAVLETSLFGNPGSLRTLPIAWLKPDLADRYISLDQELWNFKQKFINLIIQHEEKKKILQLEPTVRKDFTRWISGVVKALSKV